MSTIRRILALAFVVAATAGAAESQDAADPYFRAVAEFFGVSAEEVDILREWRLDAQEVPVVLFVAGRAGVSPEALAQLRRSGRGWNDLSARYGLDASHFHVPLREGADAHALAATYERYRSMPASEWRTIALNDREIVILVNVRMVAQTLRLPPGEVLAAQATTPSFVDLYPRLIR